MKLHLENATTNFRITGYGDGFVAVNEEQLSTSMVVMPGKLIRNWPPREPNELTSQHLETVVGEAPELILLGTGDRQHFPPAAVAAVALQKEIGLEVMDTAAACRTYNILAAEGRTVAAALIINSHS